MKLELDGLTKEFGDFTAVNHINLRSEEHTSELQSPQ